MLRFVVACACLAVSISAQQSSNAPTNCVLNEKRPNPGNSQTFFHCKADGPTLMRCPETMTFDSKLLECVRLNSQSSNNVTLTKIPISQGWSAAPPSTNGWIPPPPPTPPGGWAPTTVPPTSQPPVMSDACMTRNADGMLPQYLPGPTCTQFYECSYGYASLFTCPAGLNFNPVLDVCDYPYEAGCITSRLSVVSVAQNLI